MENRFAIVVPSCDHYSDLWEGFLSTLKRRWNFGPASVYVISNHKPCPVQGTIPICVGDDQTWSANLITALRQVPHEYVLLFLEDLFLKDDVDAQRVEALIRRCIDSGWDYLRLNPTPAPANDVGGGVGHVPRGDLYRTSTVLSLWKREMLLSVLRPDESAWDFEVFGSHRTDHSDAWYACTSWNLPHHNLVIKGKIDRWAYRQLERDGTAPRTMRQFMTRFEDFVYRMRLLRLRLVELFVPRGSRRRLQIFFKAMR